MTDTLPPLPVYDEKLIVDWLLTQEVVTDLLGSGIWTILPANLTFPVAKVARVGGAPDPGALWSDHPLLQFDVWADRRADARLCCDTLRWALSTGLVGAHDAMVVTKVDVGGPHWLPDTSYTPAKPRFTFDVAVSLHPPTS